MKSFKFRRFLIATLYFFLVMAGARVFAGGSQEKKASLEEADKMIEKKDYDEAIQLLIELARQDDERFDNIQKRLRAILGDVNGYTKIANTVLDILRDNPDDLETMLKMTREMAAMNVSRSENAERFFDNIEQTARLVVNQREFDRILQNGRDLLDRGEYLAAMRMYETGFILYQPEMFRDGFGAQVENTTRTNLATITNSIATLTPVITSVSAARAGLLQLDANSTDNAQFLIGSYNSLLPQMATLSDAKARVAEIQRYFAAEYAKLMSEGSEKEGRSFFGMAAGFIAGRSAERQEELNIESYLREGILGAIDGIWNSVIDPLEIRLKETSDALYVASLNAAEQGNYGAVGPATARTTQFNATPLALCAQWQTFTAMDDVAHVSLPGQNLPETKVGDFLRYQAMNDTLVYMGQAGELGPRYSAALDLVQGRQNTFQVWQTGAITTLAALNQERQSRETYVSVALSVQTALDSNSRDREQQRILGQSFQQDSATRLRYFDNTQRVLENLLGSIGAAELASASRIYQISNGDLEKRIANLEKTYSDGARYQNGMPVKLETGDEITGKFPREALSTWTGMEANLSAAVADSRQVLNNYQTEPPRIATNNAIINLRAETARLGERLTLLQNRERDSAQTARAQIASSENYQRQAEQSLDAARSALNENNFDLAHSYVERSAISSNQALALQESSDFRSRWDQQLISLNTDITRLERASIEREVRELVNEARSVYFEGNFDRSEEMLVRAETRWSKISTEHDEDVSYWLTIVRGALSLRSGRNIPITAPLYPEMSQLLSAAQLNYNEGVRLLNANNRQDGLKKFAVAREKTQEVRLMFPVNQDAGILELKIDQIIDPPSFEQSFAQRVQAAIIGSRSRSVQAFADLQNLVKINPRYPGIQAALAQAEIDMGVRPAPPDTRLIARSNEMLAAAQRLFRANNRSQYQTVLDNVNEAVRLNPNNSAALQFRQQVQIAMGSAAVSAEDRFTEQEYIRAVLALQNGNALLALSIVQRLRERPQSRSDPRITELLRRIEASTGAVN